MRSSSIYTLQTQCFFESSPTAHCVQVSRDEAAEALAQCVQYPDAAYKTFELRRNEAPESKGVRSMSGKDYTRMFIKLALGENGPRINIGLNISVLGSSLTSSL